MIEVEDPVPEQLIRLRQGKRVIELRVSSRAECRALIAALAKASAMLPDDGQGTLTLAAAPAPQPAQAGGDGPGHGDAARQDEAVAGLLPGAEEAEAARRDDTWVQASNGLPANTGYCPASLRPGIPCARLAGHPLPHRTMAGIEWVPFPATLPQCPAGLLREAEDWGASCRKDAGHAPPHGGQDGEWADDHPRHVADLNAHDFSAPPAAEPMAVPPPDGGPLLPDCTRDGCLHPESAHAADDEETADGPCLLDRCRCPAYLVPETARLAAVTELRPAATP